MFYFVKLVKYLYEVIISENEYVSLKNISLCILNVFLNVFRFLMNK